MDAQLRRLVARVAVLGIVLLALAAYGVGSDGPISRLELPFGLTTGGAPLAAGLLALTLIADLVAVRVQDNGEAFELTLFDAAVVVDVLLLPGMQALALPVIASMATSVVRRREPIKAVFNAGNLAAATAVLVGSVHLAADPGEGLSWRTVLSLSAGMLGFHVINSVALSHVLALVGGGDAWDIARDGARLAAITATGTVALGATVVVIAGSAPALLPFSLIPAVALRFAYRAAAQEAEERERSSKLLALSQLLAGRLDADEVVGAFLDLTRKAFSADIAIAVLDPGAQPGGSVPTAVVDDEETGYERRTAGLAEQLLLLRASQDGALALSADLPPGWTHALISPLEAEGRRLGAVVLATRDRHRKLGQRELTLLTPLASALAVALRGAAHVQRLTEETSKLKAVVDQSSDGILVLDSDGRVLLWSPALETLTGRTELAALGRPLGQLVATLQEDGQPVDPFRAGAALLSPDEPRATVELTVLRDDGERRVVRCAHAGAFGDDGGLVRDVVIVHDVTRERQVERLKADFIATVSHELRTPITPIKGYADLLRRRGEAMTPDKRAECLEVISSRTEHLARLVEDLLLASRISATEGAASAQVEMASAELSLLVRRACGDFGTDGERIVLDLPTEPVQVGCDPLRAVQVLSNLVGNALKYSAAGTPVDVRLTVHDGRAVVEVADRGRGIPADQLERVFDKFHRVEDPMRMTTGGTGLGLYIARELASAMGGTISCRSTLGIGSVFSFELPVDVSTIASSDVVTPLPRPRLVPSWAPDAPRPDAENGPAAARTLG